MDPLGEETGGPIAQCNSAPKGRTGWSIKKFVRTARRYRTITIRAGTQTLTAQDPLPSELRDALEQII